MQKRSRKTTVKNIRLQKRKKSIHKLELELDNVQDEYKNSWTF